MKVGRAIVSLAFGAAAALGVTAGCLLELEHRISCGDGYIDTVAGENCDPAADFDRDGCRQNGLGEGDTKCDPETCRLMLNQDDCALCGDGIASGNEPCDGADFSSGYDECPSGKGTMRCFDDCTLDLRECDPCGDGVLNPGEECDPNRRCESNEDCGQGLVCDMQTLRCVGDGGILPVTQCFDLEVTGTPVEPKADYEKGVVTPDNCTESCRYDRSSCSFCGDGVLDPAYTDIGPDGNPGAFQPAEVCDGEVNNPDSFGLFCKQACFENPDAVAFQVACLEASCNDNCNNYEFVDPVPPPDPDPVEDLGCCLVAPESCAGSPPFPCCWELVHGPGDDGCDPVFNGPEIIDMRCRAL